MRKYILSLFVFALVFAFFGVNASFAKASTDCSFSRTLKVGLAGNDVACLQQNLGISADGKFGPKTKAAVLAWQARWGLMVDGMFGAKSRANWVAHGGNSGNFPEGCESASGYSRTTGKSCYAIPSVQSSVVISGVSGPQKLNVGQQGTWTVTAYDKNEGDLSYSVIWGDEVYAYPTASSSGNGVKVEQYATFTHSYAQAGVYKPIFTVMNNIVCVAYPCPNSASTSLSVNVGGIIVPTEIPTISSISPAEGVSGSQVTIVGSGFTATGNRIKFGDTNSENNPKYSLSPNKIACFKYPCPNSITFTVPSTYYVPCLETTPSCSMATRMIQPGTYEVSVINDNGTSNAVKFVVEPTNILY
ncbi:MAG: IPT/TIG domain-containing protein [Candidatus Paceibacterota bacterium]|jgi:peptidoglycan hydrolase-like protein with peptidoglycan-binding domain